MTGDSLSWKRFLSVVHIASTVLGAAIALVCGPAANASDTLLRALGGALFGFWVSSCVYLFDLRKEFGRLDIPAEELNQSEIILLKSVRGMVHFRSGRPLRFWEGVGGKLFLTNQVLEFRAHRGQPWVYRVTISLSDIAGVRPCKILGCFPGGLRVDLVDGRFELFTFGIYGTSPAWAATIRAVREANARGN